MKAVLISIQPKWCELIASGKKTVEVRKSKPKLETPFKCYIYETKGKKQYFSQPLPIPYYEGKGKVIGEFMCDKIYDITPHFDVPTFPNQYIFEGAQEEDSSCLSFEEINSYLKGNQGYGLHISDLVIYDKPKELSEFNAICPNMKPDGTRKNGNCPCGKYTHDFDETTGKIYCTRRKTRPPQSWCYVEELI